MQNLAKRTRSKEPCQFAVWPPLGVETDTNCHGSKALSKGGRLQVHGTMRTTHQKN